MAANGGKEIKVVTTVAMKAALDGLAERYARQAGAGIAMAFGPPDVAARMIRDGEPADVIITTPSAVEGLVRDGKVLAGPNPIFARMFMGLCVRAGAPKPDISTVEGFKQALLGAKSLTYADPAKGSPSGAHFARVIERLGIADAINAKAAIRSGTVATLVADGEVEMAVQQMSELMMIEGVDVVGPFPSELQNIVDLSVGVLTASDKKTEAQALVSLLASAEARPIFEKTGLMAVS
jgi:molybdate transport system substrate-binding protein